MVSRDGFETWFDYQVGLTLLAAAAVAAVWVGGQLLGVVDAFSLPPERLALYVAGSCLLALLPLFWLARRQGEKGKRKENGG